jgi:metal-responsive CopG/Arc/MetJ family transcriptional regulator
MLYDSNMPAKPVQISMDTALLRRIDADPEARENGRSAFVRSAVELYLTAKERKEIDDRIERGYAGQADALLAEAEDLIGAQAWPDD